MVLMATLENVSRRCQMRDRLPRGPPSASRASSSSSQTELIMWGVQVSAPTRSRVRRAKIVAIDDLIREVQEVQYNFPSPY